MNPTAAQLATMAKRRTTAVARIRTARPGISAREAHRRADQAQAARRGRGRAIVAGLLLLAGLTACAPESGYVTGHSHNNSWVEMRCSVYRSNGTCSAYMPVTHPEEWCLTLRNGEDTGDQCFNDASIWDRYPVGSHYPDAR